MKSALMIVPLCLATASGFVMRCSNFGKNIHMTDQGQHDRAPAATTPLGRRAFIQGAVASVPVIAGASQALADNEIIEQMVADKRAAGWVEPEVTQRGYMDITIGDKPAGRLVIAQTLGDLLAIDEPLSAAAVEANELWLRTPHPDHFFKDTDRIGSAAAQSVPIRFGSRTDSVDQFCGSRTDSVGVFEEVVKLYGKVVPNTVKNFVSLLTGKNEAGVSYQGTEAYRVLSELNIQMGAIGSRSGKSGVSSTGENIPQENFDIPHMKEGLLSMVRNQDAQGDSRFFISIKDDAGWADNRYVAFGRVAEGMDVVHQIERVKVDGGSNRPKSPVVVDACGLL